jgi:hypothetical protein
VLDIVVRQETSDGILIGIALNPTISGRPDFYLLAKICKHIDDEYMVRFHTTPHRSK